MRVQRDGRSFKVDVVSDGEGLVSHEGSALLAGVAEKTGLTGTDVPVARDGAPADEGSCVLSADPVKEQAASLFTGEPQVLHSRLNPWIIGVGVVVEHHEGSLSECWAPRFYLSYGVLPLVGAIDVQQLNHPAVSWALIARDTHQRESPPSSWTHQPQIPLTLGPLNRVITQHYPPRFRQDQ